MSVETIRRKYGQYPIKILEAFSDSEFDLSIKEIAKIAGVTRETTSKYISILEAYGLIRHTRKVGNAKFYDLK